MIKFHLNFPHFWPLQTHLSFFHDILLTFLIFLSPLNKKKKQQQQYTSFTMQNQNVTISELLLVHLSCVLGLASSIWVAHNVYSVNLIDNPSDTLRLIWVVVAAVVILTYSLFRHDQNKCSYIRAILRGLLALPTGAVVNAFGAIVLGAPATQHFSRTVYWSLLMSVLTFVPAASVFGSSWSDWHRIFAHSKPIGPRDYMISLPAHGAIIGAWFGAWPMPLDWERPWQEWPICVSYGALTGYVIGMVASLGLTLYHNQRQHVKDE